MYLYMYAGHIDRKVYFKVRGGSTISQSPPRLEYNLVTWTGTQPVTTELDKTHPIAKYAEPPIARQL